MSQSASIIRESKEKKNEFENFFKVTLDSKNNVEEISKLRKQLREKQKDRTKSQNETHILKNKVKALKTEEEKAIKKIEQAKKNLVNIENTRKNLLENKIYIEEKKYVADKEFESKKVKIAEHKVKKQEFLKTWKISLAQKNHEEKMKLNNEKRNILRKINIDKQEEEEKNKQLCIKVKTSKISYVDKKQQLIEEKKKKLKKDILDKLHEEIQYEKTFKETAKLLSLEENNIKDHLKTIETTHIDDCKFNY